MADESDLEKTESASPRRIEQAREEGQVPASRELSTFLVMIAGAAGLWVMGSWLAARLSGLMRNGLTLDRQAAFDEHAMGVALVGLAGDALLTLLPLFAALLVAAVASPIVMGGWLFAPKSLSPDVSRLDPLKGFGRIFSVHGLAELVKAVAKSLVVGGAALWVMWRERDVLLALMEQPLQAGLASFGHVVVFSALLIVSAMAFIAAVDVPFQLWQYYRRLRMSKEEVRREAKEMEGDPQVKARIRSQQREMARRRMMSEVPKADVVVTNPTHFSVALKYDAERMRAPRVVAKGRGPVALRIREIGREHGVPMLEAPPLARALYKHTEIGDDVPAPLYTAVAEVMAYVYQLNAHLAGKARAPQAPGHLDVPEGMDPGAQSA